jgi:hypothetical protein
LLAAAITIRYSPRLADRVASQDRSLAGTRSLLRVRSVLPVLITTAMNAMLAALGQQPDVPCFLAGFLHTCKPS